MDCKGFTDFLNLFQIPVLIYPKWIINVADISAIAIDRLRTIDEQINSIPTLMIDKDIISARKAYTQEFFRCCNELSLSPQARAKIGSLNFSKKKEQTDPLLQILKRANSS